MSSQDKSVIFINLNITQKLIPFPFNLPSYIYKTDPFRGSSNSKFLSGDDYTIADIATFPWIARHEWHDIGLKNYKNLTRWYIDISKREGVIKGFAFMNKEETVPKP